MSKERQAGIMIAVAISVGFGILVYELSWYASEIVVRVLLAMAIPAFAVSLMASMFYTPKTTETYYDPYTEQRKAEEAAEPMDDSQGDSAGGDYAGPSE